MNVISLATEPVMNDPIPGYYAAQQPERPLYADALPKQGVDVVVLGGGLAGLTTALELAKRGKSVVVCEARRVGWGASGRNGGFVSPGFAEGMEPLERKLGFDHARALHSLSVEGVDYVQRTIENASRSDLIQGYGSLELMRHPMDLQTIAEDMDKQARYGHPSRLIDRDALPAYVKSDAYHLGFLSENAFHIDPLGYANLLATRARKNGAHILEETAVTDVQKSGGALTVTAGPHTIKAQHVVFSGSAYMADINSQTGRQIRRAVLPVATYVVATEPLGKRIEEAIPFIGCIADTRRAGDYYRRINGNRLLWGGRITTQKAEPASLAQMLKKDIQTVYPQLGDVQIEYAWSGLMGYCVHKMPLIAPLGDGLWVNTGFGGHGLNTTAMGGILIAEAISGDDDRLRPFAPFKAQWGGGLIGKAATQAIYWQLQIQDAWDERRRL